MGGLTHGSLFAGIGGFDLGFERAGFTTIWQVEYDPYCQAVLAKHFPTARRYADIRSVHGVLAHAEKSGQLRTEQQENDCQGADWRGTDDTHQKGQGDCDGCLSTPTVLTGGFPCQPFSVAGKRRGISDDRWLWPQMRRIIAEVRPRWVVAENVPGLIKMALDAVLSDLEALGYTTGAITIPACAVDAPHRRERLWIVAHTSGAGSRSQSGNALHEERSTSQNRRTRLSQATRRTDGAAISDHQSTSQDVADPSNTNRRSNCQTQAGRTPKQFGGRACGTPTGTHWWLPEPNVGRVAHGVPHRVHCLRALGNAIIPQIAEAIAWMIRRVIEDAGELVRVKPADAG